jgi:hypothetical protein
VKPETAAFLGKAPEALAKADGMLARWPDEAGREAYVAALHAAQALIVEDTGKLIKSHKGVRRELGHGTAPFSVVLTNSRPLPIMKPARIPQYHPNRLPMRLRQRSASSPR